VPVTDQPQEQPEIDPVLANLRKENQLLLARLQSSGVQINLQNLLLTTLLDFVLAPTGQLEAFFIEYETRVASVLHEVESRSTRQKLLQGVVPGQMGGIVPT
jgi:hypothetical protein